MSGHRRRKAGGHEEHHVDERWLVSYADMITVLMALFIVLYAMSTVDSHKYDLLKNSLATGFGVTKTAKIDQSDAIVPKQYVKKNGAGFSATTLTADTVAAEVKKALATAGESGKAQVSKDGTSVTISLVGSSAYFDGNEAALRPEAPSTTPSTSRCSCGRFQTTAASALDCRMASTASSPGLEVATTSTPAMARLTSRRGPSRTRSAMVQTRRATCSRRSGPADRTSRRARSTSARITRACSTRMRPAGVNSAPRGVRSKSMTCKSRSSARICWESDGAAMCNRRAAAKKRRSSATAKKYLSWRSSTKHATAGSKDRPDRR